MVYNHRGITNGGAYAPLYTNKMLNNIDFVLVIKYILCALLTISIIFAPAWIARQNNKGKPDMHAVRLASWIFGWSIIGWLWSLFWATRK